MSVVAIKCQHCFGEGMVLEYDDPEDFWITCEICDGTGTERPPQDEDTRARQAIESMNRRRRGRSPVR